MSARAAVAIAGAGLVLLLAGCAAPLTREQLPFESGTIEVAPGAPYERCLQLAAGDRLYFAYQVDPPMTFSLRRSNGPAVVSYVVRDAGREDTGLFLVPEAERYCLHWNTADGDRPWPTLLRFELRLTTTDK